MTLQALEPGSIRPAGGRVATADRNRHLNTFTELTKKVQEAGLLKRCYGFYWSMLGGALLALCGIGAGLILLGDSWFQLLLAAALGLIFAQLGFLGHEASHRQIFRSSRWNEWVGRILAGLGTGLSYGWWMNKHNRHHANPNRQGKDPDIGGGAIDFTGDASATKTGLRAKLVRRQGYYFVPLMLLEGVSLHVAAVRRVLSKEKLAHRPVEIAFLSVRIFGYLAVLFILLPPGLAAAFAGVQLAVFGLLLGAAFAPNHVGMPIVARDAKLDFVRRQVLMSRNIRGGPVVRFLMGGLDNQVEHHLFPMMARPNLRRARRIVMEHCRTHAITYTETTVWQSYRVIVRYLNEVGLKNRHTFSCPVAQQYRL
jgi:fatty acid desaturase